MAQPPGEGWKRWEDHIYTYNPRADNPYRYEKIELWRDGWDHTVIEGPYDSPYANGIGLYWRPAR